MIISRFCLAVFLTSQLILSTQSISIPSFSKTKKQQTTNGENNPLDSYWHLKLLGSPRTELRANQFIYIDNPKDTDKNQTRKENKQSMIYTITEKNILAAIEPNSGSVGRATA